MVGSPGGGDDRGMTSTVARRPSGLARTGHGVLALAGTLLGAVVPAAAGFAVGFCGIWGGTCTPQQLDAQGFGFAAGAVLALVALAATVAAAAAVSWAVTGGSVLALLGAGVAAAAWVARMEDGVETREVAILFLGLAVLGAGAAIVVRGVVTRGLAGRGVVGRPG